MTDAKDSTSNHPEMDAESVMQWLKDNPNFTQTHPEACEYLTPPKEKSSGKGVADFQHYMVKKLREDREAVMDDTREIVEISRMNMQNLTRIHNAVLRVLACKTMEELSQVLTSDVCSIMDVDLAVFVFETSGTVNKYINLPGIRLVPEGTISHWLKDQTALLESDIYGVEDIYGGGARLVRSQAILKLNEATNLPQSILAFGSRDPDMFAPNQGIEMVNFLTRVIERSLERLMEID